MDLTHTFIVPAPIETTWAAFNDLESIAPCMPGATVQVVDDNDFTGTIKIKLGPISLVYGGSGTYVERDEAARRVVIDAKGKDKRGQGTAGAKVTATLSPDGDGTRVEVQTDLAITGKPAQFGRGVMQDVSDKLLSQFVGCITDRLTATTPPEEEAAAPAPPAPETAEAPAPEAAEMPAEAPATADAEAEPASGRHAAEVREPTPAPRAVPAPGPVGGPSGDPLASEAAELDLGATVLPVLARRYGARIAVWGAALVVVWWILRRLRS